MMRFLDIVEISDDGKNVDLKTVSGSLIHLPEKECSIYIIRVNHKTSSVDIQVDFM